MKYEIDTEKELLIYEYTNDDDIESSISVEGIIREINSTMYNLKTEDDFNDINLVVSEAYQEIRNRVNTLNEEIRRILNIRDELTNSKGKLDKLYISHEIFNTHNQISK